MYNHTEHGTHSSKSNNHVKIKDKIMLIASRNIPFTYSRQGGARRVDTKQLITSVLIVICTGAFTAYTNYIVLKTQFEQSEKQTHIELEYISKKVSEVSDNQKRIMRDLYIPVTRQYHTDK